MNRGKENVIQPIVPEQGIGVLRHQAHTPVEEALHQRVYELVDLLAKKVPLWEMACNMDLDAARVSFEAMSGGKSL